MLLQNKVITSERGFIS